jgi:hypothetical protein
MILSTGTASGLAYILGKQNDYYAWQDTFSGWLKVVKRHQVLQLFIEALT